MPDPNRIRSGASDVTVGAASAATIATEAAPTTIPVFSVFRAFIIAT